MASGDDHAEKGRGQFGEGNHVGEHVPFEMVHCDEGHVPRKGEGLGGHDPHEEGSHEPRPGGHGDKTDLLRRLPYGGPPEHFLREGEKSLEVHPRGKFRNNPSVGGMGLNLARKQLGNHIPFAPQKGHSGVVAAALDSEGKEFPLRRSHLLGSSISIE